MSVIKPDIFTPDKEKEDFYVVFPDKTIKQEIPKIEPKMSLDEFRTHIDEYAKNYEGDVKKLYDYSYISAKTHYTPYNSSHYFSLITDYLLITLKKTNPDKNFDNIEKFLENTKIELEKILKDDNIPNELYIPCILGIYRGLI